MNKLSRREMLERSMLAAGAAIPVVSAAPVPGRDATRRVGPNERLRVAVVGAARLLKEGGYETRGIYAGGMDRRFAAEAQDVLVEKVYELAKKVGREVP